MAFGCGAMAFNGIGIKLQLADYWCDIIISQPLTNPSDLLPPLPPSCRDDTVSLPCARSGVEIEAPLDGSTPVEIHGAATIDGILIGPPNSVRSLVCLPVCYFRDDIYPSI